MNLHSSSPVNRFFAPIVLSLQGGIGGIAVGSVLSGNDQTAKDLGMVIGMVLAAALGLWEVRRYHRRTEAGTSRP